MSLLAICSIAFVAVFVLQCVILALGFGRKGPRRLRSDPLSWAFVFAFLAVLSDLGLVFYIVFRSHADYRG